MVKVTYIAFDGAERVVDVAAGLSVMEGAVRNNVAGITGECGGVMSCGTCHVHVDPDWLARTGAKSEVETAMLEFAIDAAENSRLGCQIKLREELDGLIVRTPETQGA